MSEVNNKAESKVEVKRIRARNSYDAINQIVETFNSSQGWALKKVSMIGMNIDVVVERSADQATQAEESNTDKVVSNEKTKEAVTEASTTSEKSDEVTVVVDEEDKPKARTTRNRTTKK